jgi:Na+-driven multidrug efflux pump
MAIICGAAWGAIGWLVPFFYLNLLLASGVGFAIGELISLSVNRKRSRGLAAVAGSCVVISYLVTILSPWGVHFSLSSILYLVIDLLALALGIFVAVTRLR